MQQNQKKKLDKNGGKRSNATDTVHNVIVTCRSHATPYHPRDLPIIFQTNCCVEVPALSPTQQQQQQPRIGIHAKLKLDDGTKVCPQQIQFFQFYHLSVMSGLCFQLTAVRINKRKWKKKPQTLQFLVFLSSLSSPLDKKSSFVVDLDIRQY